VIGQRDALACALGDLASESARALGVCAATKISSAAKIASASRRQHVSAMVVQAEAGEALLERDLERARNAFVSIMGSGRLALVELRRMLGLLMTRRELEVLILIARGFANSEIASRLFVSEATRACPRDAHPREARPARPHPGGRARLRERPRPAGKRP